MKQPPPVAVITGAAQRIGAALVRYVHQNGFRVVIHYHHSKTAAQHLAEALNAIRPNSAVTVEADLCSSATLPTIISAAIDRWGQLDLLVNNASIFSRDDADWERMWQCNVRGPYHLSRVAEPYLQITQGCIVNITDIHAQTPLRGYPAYCQTKAALLMQTRALAQEFAPNIRVNAIAPGAVLWPEGDNQLDRERREKIIDKTLVKRHGNPDHIAQALGYLIHNTYVTGQSLQVDGGRYLL